MKILDFGSANFDHVYTVDHIVSPGETIASKAVNRFFGGKGLNQAVAIARAGGKVFFAGHVGEDGEPIEKLLDDEGIDSTLLGKVKTGTGHAIIQVSDGGENSIIICAGANFENTREYIDHVLEGFGEGDILTSQNEVNLTY